jgi:hypothetical protein
MNKKYTVDTALRNCLMMYPAIFPNKWSVYHHWFCVNGNGYEWIEGELRYSDEEANKPIDLKGAIEHQFGLCASEKELLTTPLKYLIARLQEGVLSLLDVETGIVDFTPKEKLYPLCQYAKIMNIPDNIKPEWLEAVKEMYNYLLSIYGTTSEENRKYIDKIKIP